MVSAPHHYFRAPFLGRQVGNNFHRQRRGLGANHCWGPALGSIGGHVFSVTPPTLIVFAAPYVFTNGCESTPSIDFGITNKFQQVGEFTHTESMNNEVGLYVHFSCLFVYLPHLTSA